MKRNLVTAALCLLFLITAFDMHALTDAREETSWSYSQRDVWIDGQLSHSTLVYRDRESDRILLVDQSAQSVTVLDPESGEVSRYPSTRLTSSTDLLNVTTTGEPGSIDGAVWKTSDGVVAAATADTAILISRHQSPSGVLDTADFLTAYPVWDALRESYTPDERALAALRAIDEPTRFDVVFATWCGDSRREVPRLLKTIEAAGNRNLTVRLIGLDSEFEQPLDVIQDRRIINVPTVIVERDAEEIGRMIETPAAATIEADLVAIATGNPEEHQGRWTREARTSHGVYELSFSNGHRGTETWEIFATESGGKLTHSVIRAPHLEREIWHRFDDAGRTEFIEITDRTEDAIRRSRIRVSDDHVRVTSRGNRSGIIDQYLGLPQNCIFATGSVLSDGLECGPFAEGSAVEIVRYSIPFDACASVGCLETVKLVRGASTKVDTGLGVVVASEIVVETAGELRRVWFAPEIDIPVRLESPDRKATLASHEIEG